MSTPAEKAEVITPCDHLQMLKFSKSMPNAFTEHGAIQAANLLASARAVEMGIYVVRSFVRLKQASTLHADLAKRLAELDIRPRRKHLLPIGSHLGIAIVTAREVCDRVEATRKT